jgi:hypothetical protein
MNPRNVMRNNMQRTLVNVACMASLAACGRIGFDRTAAADGPGGPVGDARTDDAPALAAWQLVQAVGAGTSSTPTNTVTIAATGANHLIIVAVEDTDSTTRVSSIADDAPGGSATYVAVSGTLALNTVNVDRAIELWYTTASRSGAQTITATCLPNGAIAIVAWEVVAPGPVAIDSALAISNAASTALPTSPPIATSAAGEFFVAAALVEHNVTAIHTGSAFVNDSLAHGNGWAHLTANDAPAGSYSATWDVNTAGGYGGFAAAFKVR